VIYSKKMILSGPEGLEGQKIREAQHEFSTPAHAKCFASATPILPRWSIMARCHRWVDSMSFFRSSYCRELYAKKEPRHQVSGIIRTRGHAAPTRQPTYTCPA
jgi:hypothetical protein